MIATMDELDRVRGECRRMVTKRSLMSAGVAVVPVPGVDVVADIGLLSQLLPTISSRFELDHERIEKLDPKLAQQVFVIAASMGNNMIGRIVTRRLVTSLLRRMGVRIATGSIAKYVPLIGSAVAASISFGAMRAVGMAHIDDCYATAKALIAGPDDAIGQGGGKNGGVVRA